MKHYSVLKKELINGLNINPDGIYVDGTLGYAGDAKEILRFDDEFNINIIAASYKNETFVDTVDINDSVGLIVGDRHRVIEYAIESGAKIIILTNNSWIKDEHLELAREKKVINFSKTLCV